MLLQHSTQKVFTKLQKMFQIKKRIEEEELLYFYKKMHVFCVKFLPNPYTTN